MTKRRQPIPARHPAVSSAELDGEAILYDERDGRVHVLNHTATILWACLGTEGSITDLVGDIADAYDVSPSTIEADVLATLEQFTTAGLVDDGRPWEKISDEELPPRPRYLDEPPSV